MSGAPQDSSLKRKRENEAPSPQNTSRAKRRNKSKKRKVESREPNSHKQSQHPDSNPTPTAAEAKVSHIEAYSGSEKRKKKRSRARRHQKSEKDRSVPDAITSNGSNEKDATRENAAARRRKRRSHKYNNANGAAADEDTQIVSAPTADDVALDGALVQDSWLISAPIGGRLIDKKPLFSSKDKHLLLATDYNVQVYSTSNSTLEISFAIPDRKGVITSFAFAADSSKCLYTATSSGLIQKWNWSRGKEKSKLNTKVPLQEIMSVVLSGNTQDTVFTIHAGKYWEIVARNIEEGKKAFKSLLQFKEPLRQLQITKDGSTAATITADSIIVGNIASNSQTNIKEVEYIWRAVSLEEPPTCFSMRLDKPGPEPKDSSPKRSKKSKNRPARVNLAIGGVRGCIYILNNVLRTLDRIELPKKDPQDASDDILRAQKLHWHREAVGAVEWSKDGRYLLSGGKETVLVLWQLENGGRQFLPNLESPIQHLVVTPDGSSYGIALADNSVMVLSATELVPTANVAGLQSPSTPAVEGVDPILPTLNLLDNLRRGPSSSVAKVLVNPKRPQDLMLAVSGYQSSSSTVATSLPTPYLQSYNLTTARHISRDELTRTNATRTNLGPGGRSILDPDVTLMQVSADGQWLATVDEWTPPRSDVEIIAGDDSDTENAIAQQREVLLKFWYWNEQGSNWVLHATIMKPHEQTDGLSSGIIFDLQADPYRSRFATIGQDSIIKVWQPKQSLNGKQGTVRPVSNIPLEQAMLEDPLQAIAPVSARLAYSNDGSILAVYQNFEDAEDGTHDAVHLIDVDEGKVRFAPKELCTPGDTIVAMGFLERHLLCVGMVAAIVFDVVTLSVRMTIPLQDSASYTFQKPLLAINLPTGTFAIATPEPRYETLTSVNPLDVYKSTISIFRPGSAESVFDTELPRLAMALVSAGGLQAESNLDVEDLTGERRGYLVVDAGATIRSLKPARYSASNLAEVKVLEASAGVDNTLSSATQVKNSMPNTIESDDESEEDRPGPSFSSAIATDETPTVNREQLGQVFDYPSHAMPPIRELLRGVVRLFSRKPHQPDHAGQGHQATEVEDEDEEQLADDLWVSNPSSKKNHFESIVDSDSDSDEQSSDDGLN